nr:MAG TPA: heme degrading enzyme-like protein [Caudoviricetes sp.]
MKRGRRSVGYGEILDEEGYVVFRVFCQDDSKVEPALEEFLNDTRESVRATKLETLIDNSRKRK